jgi:hypothetical protein
LQELSVIGFDVGNQADLFEQIFRQILSLVNDQNRFLAVFDLFEKKFADGGDGL